MKKRHKRLLNPEYSKKVGLDTAKKVSENMKIKRK